MPTVDLSHFSPQERLDLTGEFWDGLAPDAAPVAAGQKADIKRRLATLDKEIAKGRNAAEVQADLRRPG